MEQQTLTIYYLLWYVTTKDKDFKSDISVVPYFEQSIVMFIQ